MGKGRSPCCDKNKVKRGPWSPEEDIKLITFIQKHGHDNWRSLPRQAGLLRCGKSCRLRWINYLRPDVKRGNFTKEEEETIIRLHEALGNKWSKIASHLPGRTDNEIKNVWNTHLKKRVKKSSESNTTADELSITSSSSSSSPNNTSKVVGDDGFNEQGPQVTIMAEKTDQQNSKLTQVFNELDTSMIIPENPKESSPSFSSIDSTISNLAQIVNKPEEFMGSDPFDFLGPYDTLNEVDKPNSSTVQLEIPFESDYDFWNMLDNIGSLQQSNEVQVEEATTQTLNHGHKKVEDAETRKWLHDLEKELGLGETEEEKNHMEDHLYFLPKNDDAAEAGVMDPQKTLDFEMMTNPGSDQDMAYFQLF